MSAMATVIRIQARENNTPDGLKSNVPFASFSRATKNRISSPLGTHAVLQMELSHHILNRHQSLYRRVFFLSGFLCLCAHYTRRHLLLKTKRRPTSFLSCPESIYTYSELLGSWPNYVRPSSNERKAIPSGRPNMAFFPSLCMYYALSLFNYVRLYKHCDSRTGYVFFHDGFLLSSTPSTSEQYTILFVKMHPTVAPSLLFITSLTSLTMIVQQLLALHRSRWDTQDGQAKRRIIAVVATLFTFLLATLAGILGLVASHAWRVGDHSRETRATISGKIVVVALQFGRKCFHVSPQNQNLTGSPQSLYTRCLS